MDPLYKCEQNTTNERDISHIKLTKSCFCCCVLFFSSNNCLWRLLMSSFRTDLSNGKQNEWVLQLIILLIMNNFTFSFYSVRGYFPFKRLPGSALQRDNFAFVDKLISDYTYPQRWSGFRTQRLELVSHLRAWHISYFFTVAGLTKTLNLQLSRRIA